MNNDVTVVVEDKLVIVDGRALQVDFELPPTTHEGLRAIQWHEGKGDIECLVDGVPHNHLFDADKFDEYVQPLVDLWEAQRIIEDTPPPPPTLEEKQATVRAERDSLIAKCDWTQMPDSPLNAELKTTWATYRQALRDITEDALFGSEPESVGWPIKP